MTRAARTPRHHGHHGTTGSPGSPGSPSSLSSTATAASTLKTTVKDTTTTPPRNGRFVTSMPASAMQTVAPSKTTARPEVFSAATADSSVASPRSRPRRSQVTKNSA